MSVTGKHRQLMREVMQIKRLLPPLKQYWRELEQYDRQQQARRRAAQKLRDQRRPRCRCEAYPWPHRPGGGLCRWPDPPIQRYQPKPGRRRYHSRYTGLLRRICRNSGLHPIRDRKLIQELSLKLRAAARLLKQRYPGLKLKNMALSEQGMLEG